MLEDVDLVDLTIWEHEHLESDDRYGEMIRAELGRRGGPAAPEAVREAVRRRDTQRAMGATPGGAWFRRWSRTARCDCGAKSQQLRHGYTKDGRLWKGHVCTCAGWQCTECGRILERDDECCQ